MSDVPRSPHDGSAPHASMSRRMFGQAIGAVTVGGTLQTVLSANIPQEQPAKGRGAELVFLSAVELASRIKRKQVSARDVMAAHLAQIEAVNPKVNAIVTLVGERAMADAARADELLARGGPLGPLHGLPVAHKDLVDTAGIRTTRGSPFYREHVPTADALIVTRIRAAGAVTVGKTNTPEFGAGSQTFNTVFGATRNPYDLGKTCGGSSGGAAVALACGMLPIADGSDTGGSLRNPAAFCNVVGLRPSPGRVPGASGSWQPLSVSGPMARTVATSRSSSVRLPGPTRASPLSIQEDGARFRAPLARSFKGVRVAWWRGLGGIPVRDRDPPRGRCEPPPVRGPWLRGRGGRAGLRRRGRGIRSAALRRQPPAVRTARRRKARMGQGHDQVRGRAGGTAYRCRHRPRAGAAGPHVRGEPAVLRDATSTSSCQ